MPDRVPESPPASGWAAVRPDLPATGKTGSAPVFAKKSAPQTVAVTQKVDPAWRCCRAPGPRPSSVVRRWCRPPPDPHGRHAPSSLRVTLWVPAPQKWPITRSATAPFGDGLGLLTSCGAFRYRCLTLSRSVAGSGLGAVGRMVHGRRWFGTRCHRGDRNFQFLLAFNTLGVLEHQRQR